MPGPPAATSRLLSLPDELLEAIVFYLQPHDAVAFATTCKQCNKITFEPLVWRQHCIRQWKYWHDQHSWSEKLRSPPAQTRWRHLYNERQRIDRDAAKLFDELLASQQHRYSRIEDIAACGDDVREMLIRMRDQTPDDTEDVLARRFYAAAILGQMNRTIALDKWSRLQRQQMVSLEDVLGAFDLFAVDSGCSDLHYIHQQLDRLADAVRSETSEFDELPIRRQAICVATYLRDHGLVGNPSREQYHALRNNYISLALSQEPHTSLPLQTAAIYCAVARRLGINARPSNFPQHVHVVVEAPRDRTLDGVARIPRPDAEPDTMHLDPWHTNEEIPLQQLRERLTLMSAPLNLQHLHLGPASTIEIVQRTARNIMTSVQEARRLTEEDLAPTANGEASQVPEVEAAWYSMLWAFMILGESSVVSALHRRRQCLPYLISHYQQHYLEDIGLIEKLLVPMFENEAEHTVLLRSIAAARAADANLPPPSPRNTEAARAVQFPIGTFFIHRRYRYEGLIIGWDVRCEANATWISQMNVDSLPRGRTQPFYNVVWVAPLSRPCHMKTLN